MTSSSGIRMYSLRADPADYPFVTPIQCTRSEVDLEPFERWTRAPLEPLGPGNGLIPDLSVLNGPSFEANVVSPLIRAFYATTLDWTMEVSGQWTRAVRPLASLYRRFVGGFIGTLNVPHKDWVGGREMTSRIFRFDADQDGEFDARVWQRRLEMTPFYTASLRVWQTGTEGLLCLGFPLPGANLTVVMRAVNRPDGGFGLTTRGAKPAGTYLVRRRRSGGLAVLPGLGLAEEFRFDVRHDHIVGSHREFWLGRRAFLLRYTLRR